MPPPTRRSGPTFALGAAAGALLYWLLEGVYRPPAVVSAADRIGAPAVCKERVDYIVTGGAGFIGSALVKRLRKQNPSARIKVLDNLWRGRKDNLREGLGLKDEPFVINMEQDFHEIDLTDPVLAEQYVRCADVVYHLADIVAGIDFVFSHQSFVFRQNVLINTNVLRACARNSVRDYIYVGTACSYPWILQNSYSVTRLRENQTYPAWPESAYGWSKLMGEYEAELLRDEIKAAKKQGLNVGMLRFQNVYGPGQAYGPDKSQVLPSIIRKVINYPAEKFVMWGSGKQFRDFVYLDDVLDGLQLVATKGLGHDVMNIGTGQATTILESAYMVQAMAREAFGAEVKMEFTKGMPEGDRGRVAVLDRVQSILGWNPKVGIHAGMARLFEWVVRQMAARHGSKAGNTGQFPGMIADPTAARKFLRETDKDRGAMLVRLEAAARSGSALYAKQSQETAA